MISLSKLQPIVSPEQFFNTDKVLMIDLINLGPAEKDLVSDIGSDAFSYRGRMYLPIITVGSPENHLLNNCNGIPFSFKSGLKGIYYWNKDLKAAIRQGKVFDFTGHHAAYKSGKAALSPETNFILSKYLMNEAARQEATGIE